MITSYSHVNTYEQGKHVTYDIRHLCILSPITDRKTKYTNITTLQYKALRKIFNLHNITYSNHTIITSVSLCNVIYDLLPYQCIMSLLMSIE